MATPTVPMPQLPSPERVRIAYQARNESDYIANFWTAFGWSVLTFFVYGFYIFYQLMRRDRDHTRRRLELIEGATAHAWDVAARQGVQDELRPNFERLAGHTEVIRQMTSDFRDPVIWLLLDVVTGLAQLIAFIFIDQDLVKHGGAEAGAEAELSAIYARLGQNVPQPMVPQKGQHNYVGRVIALVFSFGIYGLWWWADIMRDGNDHFEANWRWEDSLAQAVVATQ